MLSFRCINALTVKPYNISQGCYMRLITSCSLLDKKTAGIVQEKDRWMMDYSVHLSILWSIILTQGTQLRGCISSKSLCSRMKRWQEFSACPTFCNFSYIWSFLQSSAVNFDSYLLPIWKKAYRKQRWNFFPNRATILSWVLGCHGDLV